MKVISLKYEDRIATKKAIKKSEDLLSLLSFPTTVSGTPTLRRGRWGGLFIHHPRWRQSVRIRIRRLLLGLQWWQIHRVRSSRPRSLNR